MFITEVIKLIHSGNKIIFTLAFKMRMYQAVIYLHDLCSSFCVWCMLSQKLKTCRMKCRDEQVSLHFLFS